MNKAWIYAEIAHEDKTLFGPWGPCSDGRQDPCDCPQCQHADRIAAAGLDYETEYQEALKKGGGVT